jgi:glycerol-3-phosphate cytidylyltransferase
MEIVRSIEYVDAVVAQEDMDKYKLWEKLKYDVMFVGDDWFKSEKWNKLDAQFKEVNVKIVYFPYTKGTSSTLINEILLQKRTKG